MSRISTNLAGIERALLNRMAEANAAGIPVIAYDRGSCREVIEHGKTGFLVNSIEEAARALGKIDTIDRADCRRREPAPLRSVG